MPRTPAARRSRRGAGLLLLLILGLALASLRRVGDPSAVFVLEGVLPPAPARIVFPGWYFVPPPFLRITRYATTPQSLAFQWPPAGGPRVTTAEGSRVVVRGSVRFRVPAGAVLPLHRRAAGEIGARIILPELERIGREAIRSASYARISGAHRIELEAAIGARVGPWLRKSGLVLRELRVDSVRLQEPGIASLEPLPGARVLLVGLDGADWNVLDPLMAAGRLPTLSRLVRTGVRARLESIDPPISPVVWTTAATGFLPPRHGILDFVVTDRRTGALVPVTSHQRRVRAIWNILGDTGVPVGVIGWWATWPAEFVEGYVVSDRVAYQLPGQSPPSGETGKTFPPDLFGRIGPLVVSPASVPAALLARFVIPPATRPAAARPPAADRLEQFRVVLASTATYEAIATALGSGGFQRFQAIYFEGIDTTSHLFMPFRPPRRPGIDRADFARFSRAVDEFYVYQDEVLGRLLERAEPETNVLVISDHGFKSAADRPARESRVEFSTAAIWHRRHGVLIASGPAFRHGVRIADVSVVDITPTLLTLFGLPVGEDMEGRPIRDLFAEEFLSARPVAYRPSWETGSGGVRAPSASDPEGDRALRDKLISLGYLSQEGSLPRNNLGNALLAEGRIDEAIGEFRAALTQAPRFPLLHLNLARALLARGDFHAARASLNRALALDPASPEAEVLVANLDLREGNRQAAESRLRGVLRREPAAPGAHRSLGILHQERGESDQAEAEYRRALELDPDDAESYNNLGVLRQGAGRLEEAEVLFRQAMEADPHFAGAYNNLALVAMDRENWDEAERLLQAGLDRSEGNPVLLNNLGNLGYRRNRLPEAAERYRRAIAGDPGYAEPHNGLGMVLYTLGKTEDSGREFDAALRLKPDYPEARLNRGRLRHRQGRPGDAESDFRAVLAAHPNHAEASYELGRLLVERGALPEAERVTRTALTEHDSDAELWTLLGRCLTLRGDRPEAIRAFRRALVEDPGQRESRDRLRDLGEGTR